MIRQAQSSSHTVATVTGTGSAAIPGLFVAQPSRQFKDRVPIVPKSVQLLEAQMLHPRPLGLADGFETEMDRQNAAGGCTNYNPDPRRHWILENEEERYDEIPMMHNGKNILDFITVDEDITQLINQLEAEEAEIAQQKPLIDDNELFARLAAYEKAVGHRAPKALRATRIKRAVEQRRAIAEAPMLQPTEYAETEPMRAAKKTAEERLLDDGKHAVPIEVVKKNFARARKDGQKALAHLIPAVTKPKHLMTGHITLKTRDWR